MGMRMIQMMLLIFCMTTSATWMEVSGMNDHMGVDPGTSLGDQVKAFDKSAETFESRGGGVGDYLGFTVSAVLYLVDAYILLGPLGDALRVVLPAWVVWPPMTFVVRPIWTIGIIQVIRGSVFE